jgi:hypothetical protein
MMGLPMEGPANGLCGSQSVVLNSTLPSSMLMNSTLTKSTLTKSTMRSTITSTESQLQGAIKPKRKRTTPDYCPMVGTTTVCYGRTTRLTLPKYFYCTIFYTGYLIPKATRLATPEELEGDQEIDIKQRSCTTFHRTLGVDENPAGIYKSEYTHIVTKGQKYLPK